MNRVYRMSQEEYQGLLKMASDQVKKLIRGFKALGFKVLSNDGQILQPAGQDAMEGALMSAT